MKLFAANKRQIFKVCDDKSMCAPLVDMKRYLASFQVFLAYPEMTFAEVAT